MNETRSMNLSKRCLQMDPLPAYPDTTMPIICQARRVTNMRKAQPMTAHSHRPVLLRCVLGVFLVLTSASAADAQAEFHYQYGKLTNPFSSVQEYTSILTIQHATSWRLEDSFLFVDILDDGGHDGFNDKNLYGEWYPTLSFSRLSGKEFRLGPIRDIALIGGINFDSDASSGVRGGGTPRTSNSFMFDVSWALPVQLGSQSFLFGGHAEYIGGTNDEFGNQGKDWILAQPQFTWDLGAVFGAANQLLVGVEYQYWRNKLGTDEEDDNVPQLLVIWRF